MDREFFTMVFEGDVTKIAKNVFKTKTPYGRPVAVGAGNAFDKIEKMHEMEEAARSFVAAADKLEQD